MHKETFKNIMVISDAMKANFIKSIADKNITPEVHRNFVRYSLGDFEKESFTIKVSKQITIKAGFEWTYFLHLFFAEHVTQDLELSGVVETMRSLDDIFTELGIIFTAKRRFGKPGNKYEFTKQAISPEVYKKMVEACHQDYFLACVKGEEGQVKVKGKNTPKTGQPTENFVTLQMKKDKLDEIKRVFLYDVEGDFAQAVIKHTYHVEDIKVNEKLFKEDPNRARKEALRIGTIDRVITFDGNEVFSTNFDMKVWR